MQSGDRVSAFILLVILAVVSINAPRIDGRPVKAGKDTPASSFSAQRAKIHVNHLAEFPRPVGSGGHRAARHYITRQLLQLGMDVTIQEGSDYFNWGRNHRVTEVRNIIGFMPGTVGEQALLFSSHYDSVPFSPGAGDSATGTAALLEMARALKASGPIPHDVVFLFTDAEEITLGGARLFLESAPFKNQKWRLLANFDARGSSGPVLLHGTSSNNATLIRQFHNVVRRPHGNSLAIEVSRILPNSTDFEELIQLGMPGLNFAFIESPHDYHAPTDTQEKLDVRSLQHMGDIALNLAQHFGKSQDALEAGADAIFFNILGSTAVSYPMWIRWLFAFLAAVLLVRGIRQEVKLQTATQKAIGRGTILLLITLFSLPILTYLLWQGIQLIEPTLVLSRNHDENSIRFLPLLCLVGFFQFGILSHLFLKKVSSAESTFASQATLLIFTIITCLALPGASWVFTWPLLGSQFTWLVKRFLKIHGPVSLFLMIPCLLGILPLFPVITTIYAALTPAQSGAAVFFVGILLTTLAPQVVMIFHELKKQLIPILAVLTLVLASYFLMTGTKQPHWYASTFYTLDLDKNEAKLVNYGDQARQDLLPGEAVKETMPAFDFYDRKVWQKPISKVQLNGPEMEITENLAKEGKRSLKAIAHLPDHAYRLDIQLKLKEPPTSLIFEGHPVRWSKDEAILIYRGTPGQAIQWQLETASNEPLEIRMVSYTSELPDLAELSRRGPAEHESISHGRLFSYTTRVARKVTIPAAAKDSESDGK